MAAAQQLYQGVQPVLWRLQVTIVILPGCKQTHSSPWTVLQDRDLPVRTRGRASMHAQTRMMLEAMSRAGPASSSAFVSATLASHCRVSSLATAAVATTAPFSPTFRKAAGQQVTPSQDPAAALTAVSPWLRLGTRLLTIVAFCEIYSRRISVDVVTDTPTYMMDVYCKIMCTRLI